MAPTRIGQTAQAEAAVGEIGGVGHVRVAFMSGMDTADRLKTPWNR